MFIQVYLKIVAVVNLSVLVSFFLKMRESWCALNILFQLLDKSSGALEQSLGLSLIEKWVKSPKKALILWINEYKWLYILCLINHFKWTVCVMAYELKCALVKKILN